MMDKLAMRDMSNQEWIGRLRRRDGEAIADLRSLLESGLHKALRDRRDVDRADIEDFAQEAVIRVLDRLDSFRGDSTFSTWAMAIAIRISFTELRRRRWKDVSIDDRLSELATMATHGESHEIANSRSALFDTMRRAIDSDLTAKQRQVLLAELEDIPQVVLAERLSVTPGSIYKSSHDARKKLKAALARRGYDGNAIRSVLAEDR